MGRPEGLRYDWRAWSRPVEHGVEHVAQTFRSASAAHQQPPPKKVDAPEIYRTNCEACHGAEGKAVAEEMRLAGRAWKHGGRLEDAVKTIAEGVPGTAMLPFKDKLTTEEIAAVARLVRSFNKPPAGRKKTPTRVKSDKSCER